MSVLSQPDGDANEFPDSQEALEAKKVNETLTDLAELESFSVAITEAIEAKHREIPDSPEALTETTNYENLSDPAEHGKFSVETMFGLALNIVQEWETKFETNRPADSGDIREASNLILHLKNLLVSGEIGQAVGITEKLQPKDVIQFIILVVNKCRIPKSTSNSAQTRPNLEAGFGHHFVGDPQKCCPDVYSGPKVAPIELAAVVVLSINEMMKDRADYLAHGDWCELDSEQKGYRFKTSAPTGLEAIFERNPHLQYSFVFPGRPNPL